MQKHNESFTLSRICRQKHGIGGTIYASTGREYIQAPGWTLGGALYCGKEAGWAGNLPLRVRRILPFRAAKAGALPGGKPKAVITRLHYDGQRAFYRLVGGKQPAQTNQPGAIPGIDRTAHSARIGVAPGMRFDGGYSKCFRGEKAEIWASGRQGWPIRENRK